MILINRISHKIDNIIIIKNLKRCLSHRNINTTLSDNDRTNRSKLIIYHSDFITIKKSKFQSHLCKINNMEDINNFKTELMKNRKIRKATHNILVYRFINPNTNKIEIGSDDDGESGAGKRLEYMIERLKVNNIAIVVTRWFGGVLLGPCIFICCKIYYLLF